MFDQLDGVFSSKRLEGEFKDQQLQGILQFHTTFHLVLLLIYSFTILYCGIRGDFVTSLIILASGILSISQIIYFRKHPSYFALTTINMQNIIIAIYEFYSAFYQGQGVVTFDMQDEYVRGAGLFAIHLSLLVNPRLSSNVIVITIVFIINIIVLSLQKNQFHYFAIFMIVCIGLYLSRIRIELIMKRKLFILQKEKFEWESTLLALIDSPYIILGFCPGQLKFHLINANQITNKELKITDSISMQNQLREMICIKKDKVTNLECVIFNIIEKLNNINDKQSINRESFTLRRVKYIAQIFQVESQKKTFLITFKNQNQLQLQKNFKKIIVNQQIACCNFAHKQLKYCNKIQHLVKFGDKKSFLIANNKNVFQISNMLWIFKTDHKLKITTFILKDQILRISKLFPRILFQYLKCKLECRTDESIFKSIIFNIFWMFQGSQKILLDVKKSLDHIELKFIIRPVNQQTFLLLQEANATGITLNHLNQIQKSLQQSLLIFKKILQLVSPNQQIKLNYNHENGKLPKQYIQVLWHFSSSSITIWEYYNLDPENLRLSQKFIKFNS